MLFNISAKHMDIPEDVKKYAEEKTAKLPRYYNSINHVEVVIDGNKGKDVTVQIIARAEHNKVFVATQTGDNLNSCIDLAVHKLEGRVRKIKGKERDNKQKESV